jgi:hypothetical protein
MLLIYVYSFFKGFVPEIGTVCDDFTALPYDLRYSVNEKNNNIPDMICQSDFVYELHDCNPDFKHRRIVDTLTS